MKTWEVTILAVIWGIIFTVILTACSGGDTVISDQADTDTKVPPAEGVKCGDADKTNAPAGWCSNPNDVIHTGKPKTKAKPSVKRTVAKSMALIEATDEFFEQAMRDLNIAGESQKSLLSFLSQTYTEGTGFPAGSERSNQLVVDAFIEFLSPNESDEIKVFLKEKNYIFEKIKEQNGRRHFYNQPSVLLAYYLAFKMPAQTKENWPLDSTDLEKIFSDLGMTF